VIFPDAEVKFFLDAPLRARAERRWKELRAKGRELSLEEVERAERERDESDMKRDVAPLKQAEDAIVVDTGKLTIESMVDELEKLARRQLQFRVPGPGFRVGGEVDA